jgi:hypothetical protein
MNDKEFLERAGYELYPEYRDKGNGERGWRLPLSRELGVDVSQIYRWAKHNNMPKPIRKLIDHYLENGLPELDRVSPPQI